MEQTRLADLNLSYKTVNRYHHCLALPVPEKQRQVGLEAFGFILRKAKTPNRTAKTASASTTTKTTPRTSAIKGTIAEDYDPLREAEGKHKKRKRRKKGAVMRPPSLSPSPSLSPPPLSPSTSPALLSPLLPFIDSAPWSDREIAETQFAQPDPQNQDERKLAAEASQVGVSTVIASPQPLPTHMRPQSSVMFSSPTTPKRKKVVEIPNSHSPPATPISPYGSPSLFRSSQKSSLLSYRPSIKPPSKWPREWSLSGHVTSSQWWDNISQVDMPVELCGDGEQDEEEDIRFFNQKLPTGRLFQSNMTGGSSSKSDEAQFPRSIDSSEGQAEGDLDTTLVSLTEPWGDNISQRNIITVIPESPQPMRRRQGGFGDRNRPELEDELETFPRPTQPQNRFETQPNDNDFVVLESPLNTPRKRRRVIDRESGDEDRTVSTLPESSKTYPEALQETQYEDGSSKWWGSLPGWATLAADKHLIAGGAVGKKDIETSDSQEHYSEYKASDSVDLLTVSQLLPQSLMESLPMPPPLTQWSTGGVDCDEL